MSAVIIEIPESLARNFGATDEESGDNAKIELAIGMYREGKWSAGRASEFAGIYIGRFMDLLRDRGIGPVYTEAMLAGDAAYARGGR